jgi:ABC-type uncharacterized transport system substrate-binding protein
VSGRRSVQSHQSLYAACAGERASGRTNAARIELRSTRSTIAQLSTERSDVNERSAGAVIVPADTFLVNQRGRIPQFAIENKLPSVYTFREHIEAGGLIAYTPDYHDLFRRAANYVDRILRGTKPGELPIQEATKFHLLINLKTARTLGLDVPLFLRQRADEVIE